MQSLQYQYVSTPKIKRKFLVFGALSGTRAVGNDPGLLGPTKGDETQGQGPGTPDHGPCALDLGPYSHGLGLLFITLSSVRSVGS